jgi:hypothetical protein
MGVVGDMIGDDVWRGGREGFGFLLWVFFLGEGCCAVAEHMEGMSGSMQGHEHMKREYLTAVLDGST